MSDEITPEWLRVKRELEALWKGFYKELGDLDNRVRKLEKESKVDHAMILEIQHSIDRLRELVRSEDSLLVKFELPPGLNE